MTGAGVLIYRRTCRGAANALPASAPRHSYHPPVKTFQDRGVSQATGKSGATGFANGSGNISQSLNLPPNSSVTYKATGFINGTSGIVISNTANVSVPAGVTDVITADNTATDKDTVQ